MSYNTIRTKLRAIINDYERTDRDIFIYENSSVFRLSEDNVNAVTSLHLNDVEISESGNWSYSSTTNKVTITGSVSLSRDDVIEINYKYNRDYSNTELDEYIRASISNISVYNYATFEINDDDINPEPTETQENIIAIVAGVIIKPNNLSYRLPDIEVRVPMDSIPTEDIIRKIIASAKRNSHGIFAVIEINS